MKILRHSFILLFVVSAFGLFGQAKFYAKGKTSTSVGQTYTITFVLENGQGKNFKMPSSYTGFELVGGPSKSSNYSWVNGKTTSSVSYTYYLQAIKEGQFTMPTASVVVGKNILKTKPFLVLVKKGQARNQVRQQTQQKNNGRQATQAPSDVGDWKKQVGENLYVKMYTDKQTPYVGEQVTLYLKLYQRIQTFQTQVTEMPEFNGFWINDFKLQTNKWKKEEVDGIWFNTMLINKYALFPQRSGNFDLSPIKIATIVQIKSKARSNSIWDQVFGSFENKEYHFQSNTVNIDVKTLPLENIPKNFSGAVGKFKYTAKIDSLETETGKAITLKTRITGTGNVMMINAPELDLPKEFEVYDPQEKEYISKKSTYINGTKKYDYLIIPNKPGVFIIDSIPFSYFDLNSKSYKTIYANSFEINVKASADYVEELSADNDKKILDADIKDIILEKDLIFGNDDFIDKKTFWVLWSSPALVFLLLLIGKNKVNNYKPDIIGRNKKRANKLALQKLKQANFFLQKNDKKGFYNEIIRVLWDYASQKMNIKPEDLSKDNIEEKLLLLKVCKKTTNNYIELINKSEMAVFSPIGETEMLKDFESAKELIIKIEDEIA